MLQDENNMDILNSQCTSKNELDSLVYFGYRDGVTGEELTDLDFMKIAPELEDEFDSYNLIPCNSRTKIERENEDFIKWFSTSDYFSYSRLKKIKCYMQEMSLYLYIPSKQTKYIDKDAKSVNYFNVLLPNGKKKKLYYAYNGVIQNKIAILEEEILNEWKEYFESGFLHLGKTDPYKFNKEDKVKNTLNNSANYLLINANNGTAKVLNKTKLLEIYSSEMPITSLGKSAEDKFYGVGSFDADALNCQVEFEPIDYLEVGAKPTLKTYKDTRLSKLNKFLKEHDIYDFKGYKAEWCLVSTVNTFEYNGKTYKISPDVAEYKKRIKAHNFDDFTNDYDMDQVLVCEIGKEMYFLNEKCEEIIEVELIDGGNKLC